MAVAVTFNKRVPPGAASRGTLAELMARQKAAADAAATAQTMETPTIMQGLGKLGMIGADVFNERKNAKAESASRDELAKLKLGIGAQGATNQQLADIGLISPEQEQALREERLSIAKQLADQQSVERYGPVISGEQAKALGLDPAKAYQLNQATGQYDQVGGGGISIDTGTDSKLPDWAATDAKYYMQGAQANMDLEDWETTLTSAPNALANFIPGGAYLTTPEYKQAMAAGDSWIMAVLRDESGGVIGPDEMVQNRQTYLPQPGDDAATIAYKRQLRQQKTENSGFGVKAVAPNTWAEIQTALEAERKARADRRARPPADPAAPDAAVPADPAAPDEVDAGPAYVPQPEGYTGRWPSSEAAWNALPADVRQALIESANADAAARRRPRVVGP
jgi:hypothetical protein